MEGIPELGTQAAEGTATGGGAIEIGNVQEAGIREAQLSGRFVGLDENAEIGRGKATEGFENKDENL